MKIFMSLFITLFIILSISVQAGVVVKMKQAAQGISVESEQTMFIEKDRLRMEMSGEEENQTIIFRGDKNVFWVIDSDKKSYFEMTQDDIVKLKSQMEKMQEMMKEQMKNMPEEQRKMMEDMMPSGMPGEKKEKVTYTKKESGVKVGKWTTTLERLAAFPTHILCPAHQGPLVGFQAARAFEAARRATSDLFQRIAANAADPKNLAGALFREYYRDEFKLYSSKNIRNCCSLLVRRGLEAE